MLLGHLQTLDPKTWKFPSLGPDLVQSSDFLFFSHSFPGSFLTLHANHLSTRVKFSLPLPLQRAWGLISLEGFLVSRVNWQSLAGWWPERTWISEKAQAQSWGPGGSPGCPGKFSHRSLDDIRVPHPPA